MHPIANNISIVIPVYNSEKILPSLVDRLANAIEGQRVLAEVILVCDASPDNSWNVIRQLVQRHAFLRGIELMKNSGQHNAIMAGLAASRGEYVVLMDDDLQHPPEEIPRLIEAISQGFDVCYTNYLNRKHAGWKRLGSWLNGSVANFLLDKPHDVYLSSFKCLHRRVVDQIIKYDGPYTYIDGLILGVTRRIGVVDIEHRSRHEGKGNYNLRRSISLWMKMATNFSVLPLRVSTLLGLGLASLSGIAGIFIVIAKIVHPDLQAGWASLLCAVLLGSGVQLASLGIIGEYVGRIFMKINGKPQYVVREVIN